MWFALMAAMGDCGTPYPGSWRHPGPPPPWWFAIDVLAAAGGIVGGVLAQQLVSGPQPEPWSLLTSLAGAFAVGRVVGGISARVLSGFVADAPQIARQAA